MTLTNRASELTERSTEFTNELSKAKWEIDIKNYRLAALEEVKVAND